MAVMFGHDDTFFPHNETKIGHEINHSLQIIFFKIIFKNFQIWNILENITFFLTLQILY